MLADYHKTIERTYSEAKSIASELTAYAEQVKNKELRVCDTAVM